MKRIIKFLLKTVNKKKAIIFMLDLTVKWLDNIKNKEGNDLITDDTMDDIRKVNETVKKCL